jgi:hypothetical protein
MLAAAVACALPAGASRAASAKTRVYHYAIPLPKLHSGKVVLLELQTELPKNVAVGGTVAEVTITNLAKLPCYVRAAQVTRKAGDNAWHVFVPISTPKGSVVCGHPTPPKPASKVLLRVSIRPPLTSHPLSLRKAAVDGCKLLKSDLPGTLNGVSLTGYDLTWKQIALRTMKIDRACK